MNWSLESITSYGFINQFVLFYREDMFVDISKEKNERKWNETITDTGSLGFLRQYFINTANKEPKPKGQVVG